MFNKPLEDLLGSVTDSELKEALDLATTDIKVNRIGFKRRTSLRTVVEIAVISLSMLRRTEKGPAVLQTLTAQ